MPVSDPVDPAAFAVWLLGSLQSGLVAVDREARVVQLSAEAARLLVGPEADARALRGRPAAQVLCGQPRVRALLGEALQGREHPSRAELRLEAAAGGEARTVGFTLVPVRDGEGAMRGAAMWFRDLTPYERMDAQARLRDRLAALGQMAAGLAHEIRNPLAATELYAGLLERRLADRPEDRELVVELHRELRRMAATVSAGLDFVREPSLREEALDPAALLREALARARTRFDFAGQVELELAAPVPGLRGDRQQLASVLDNLVANALQAMAGHPPPDGGSGRHRLGLRAEATPDGVRLEVADTGPGVAPELRERIFYPFFTTRAEGSGVGLAEAQKIVTHHGGVLSHAPAPGGGSIFRIHLPCGEGGEGTARAAGAAGLADPEADPDAASGEPPRPEAAHRTRGPAAGAGLGEHAAPAAALGAAARGGREGTSR